MVTQKISTLKTYNKFFSHGFSLIEILVVLGLIAALAAFVIPRVNVKQGNLKSSMRQLSVLSRETRQLARMKQSTYRIVFDLDSNPPKYWVEYTSQAVTLTEIENQNNSNSNSDSDSDSDSDSEASAPNFARDEQLLKSDKALPLGIRIIGVDTSSNPEPKTSGLAYIYYWPTGLADAAVIRLSNQNEKVMSIVIQPLTGRAEFFEQEIKIQDILIE